MSDIRPQFFLVRENDTIVPLIALDELPADITIPGVARNLGMADTGGMTSVGKVPSRGAIYVVLSVPDGKDDRSPAFNGKCKGRSGNKKETGVPVDSNGRKIYCSFWLRHGECMFQQQGCQYKHIMPMDIDLLRRCGLHDIPVWYQKAYGVSSLLRPSGVNQSNWRKPRGAWKAAEHNDETVNGNGAPAHRKDNRITVTPESSNEAEKPVTGTCVAAAEASHAADLATDKGKQPVVATTTTKNGGANPVTPPNGNRFVDFERIGSASFGYKYDAPAPQTPTERLPMRARRLFEARGPNNDYSTSPDFSTPSMIFTGNSCSPFSSLGGTPGSTSEETVKLNKATAILDGDIEDADDTLDTLNEELAKFTANEPPYRSISELIPTSLPEDRYGNLILI
ncbi:Zinc finger, CCCH-type [Penicillium occitanis (nom. inval.)]|nr:hypothetical protein PENOC_057460 [Penicillium occitanis (nom. inval.)]PCH09179.1 Zinc finger, CCCH-type [Penicillium occitanis (nom. inval.)]